jgi:hypothetical protein
MDFRTGAGHVHITAQHIQCTHLMTTLGGRFDQAPSGIEFAVTGQYGDIQELLLWLRIATLSNASVSLVR